MKPRITRIIIAAVILVALIATGIGVYLYHNQGPIVGKVQLGAYYHLTAIKPTERFAGATMNHDSFFKINHDNKTGLLYLKGLNATDQPIPLIITSYEEGTQQTTIEFEYLINNGEKTQIQRLTAVSANNEIRIKNIESHSVDIIQQKYSEINQLDYNVTILVFSLDEEAA